MMKKKSLKVFVSFPNEHYFSTSLCYLFQKYPSQELWNENGRISLKNFAMSLSFLRCKIGTVQYSSPETFCCVDKNDFAQFFNIFLVIDWVAWLLHTYDWVAWFLNTYDWVAWFLHTYDWVAWFLHTYDWVAWFLHTYEWVTWFLHTYEWVTWLLHTYEWVAWFVHTY